LVARDSGAYRATNAVAILPAAAGRQAMHGDAQRDLVASAQMERGAKTARLAMSEPRQWLIKTQAGSDAREVARGNEAPQQWIVLTTWEQTDAPATGTGEVADYDTGANPDAATHDTTGQNAADQNAAGQDAAGQDMARPDGAGMAQPAQSAQGQTTITQLILRVYPANSTCARGRQMQRGARANSSSRGSSFQNSDSRGSDSKSDLNRTAILPLDSGWLFIQL